MPTREYEAWRAMRMRCHCPGHPDYGNYGKRGITVCDKWFNSFESFIADMGYRPTVNHSIDRINNNGNYEPLNCRWTSKRVQANNRRTNNIIIFMGIKYTVAEAARKFNMGYYHLWQRINRGWEAHDAILTP